MRLERLGDRNRELRRRVARHQPHPRRHPGRHQLALEQHRRHPVLVEHVQADVELRIPHPQERKGAPPHGIVVEQQRRREDVVAPLPGMPLIAQRRRRLGQGLRRQRPVQEQAVTHHRPQLHRPTLTREGAGRKPAGAAPRVRVSAYGRVTCAAAEPGAPGAELRRWHFERKKVGLGEDNIRPGYATGHEDTPHLRRVITLKYRDIPIKYYCS